MQLLFQRSYRSLTVSDISRKAGVGRATFYAHYPSKDALLASQFARIVVPMLRPRPGTAYLLDCTSLFDHVRTTPRLFRNIMAGGEGSGARVIRAALEDRIKALLPEDAGLPQASPGALSSPPSSPLSAMVCSPIPSSPPRTCSSSSKSSPDPASQPWHNRLIG